MLKTVVLFTVLALALSTTIASAAPSFSFQPPSPWQKGAISQVQSSWIIKSSPSKPTITITAEVNEDEIDFSGIDEDKIISAVGIIRSAPMKIFGITDWKAEKHQIKPIKDGNLVEIQGHYRASSGYLVHFFERDYFIGKNRYTISFFEDETGTPLQNDADIGKVLDLFQPGTSGAVK